MKYLGIDYGSKRVGIAVSNDVSSEDATTLAMAFPKKVIANKGVNSVAKLVGEIRELCVTEGVNEIVIGDSRDYHGRPNEIMKEIEAFSVALGEAMQLPLHFQLEFMTSAEASRASAEGGLKGDPSLLDASAAAIILQSFLDSQKT